jgi:hypothetical protein
MQIFRIRLKGVEVAKGSDRYEPTAAATRLVRTTLPRALALSGNESYQPELPELIESRKTRQRASEYT